MIGSLAHVNQLGTICIEESDSVFADYTRPNDIVCKYIKDVVRFLDKVCLKIYQDELLDELEGYYSPDKKVNSFYQARDQAEMVYLRTLQRNGRHGSTHSVPIVICDRAQSPPLNFSNVKKVGQYQVINILHLPLEIAALPPSGGEDFSFKYFSTLMSYIDEKNKKRVAKLVKKYRPFNLFYVLLTMPRTSGERTQFLLKFSANKHLPHPVVEHSDDWQVEMFSVVRNSKEYLVERGGADVLLSNKRVAVVGCGSVGSQVANMLAKSGVGELVLVDHDLLSADNIYRHYLGGQGLNFEADKKTGVVQAWNKVSLLSNQLQSDLPYIKVIAKPATLAKVIDDKDLMACDVVVVAVGAPSVNLQINQKLKDNSYRNVVFCWNEATGIGGHSIALDLQHSCYQCLYTEGQQLKAQSQLSLVCVGQPISKNLTGCAGVFTPFSFLDSNKTAELAASQVIDMLVYNTSDMAISWRGNNLAKLETTSRYSTMPLKEQLPIERNPDCRVCND